MTTLHARWDLARAAGRTWGARGMVRRASYELATRTGRVRSFEDRWLSRHREAPEPLRPVGVTPQRTGTDGSTEESVPSEPTIALYGGGVVIDEGEPTRWHRHPLTGHDHDPQAHWSSISDSAADQGDIKDIWERSRLGWLTTDLRRWASHDDEAAAERVWSVIEDWHRHNPGYRGPNWMCGQEASLRAITTMLLADALSASPVSTPQRQVLVASVVRDAVGRVRPTLGYALSQRNNHAISEAGFLWTTSLLAPDLPDAARIRQAAERALTEAVGDQFASDGSYAQHSPTYQRLALHVLLWVLAVSRATGAPAPAGVIDSVRRSVGFLTSLVAPGSDGRVPNLGGNDGALLFDLAGMAIGDLRPVIAHAAAAVGDLSPFGPGPWDSEAAWFGLEPVPDRRQREAARHRPGSTINVHPLSRGRVHAVLRAGPLRHRPAHADQLHLDVWIDGQPVAVDPGAYRYTAPEPWSNALAGEEVHNLPRRTGSPQAVRSGRFFWRTWSEASVTWAAEDRDWNALLARLVLPDRSVIHRLVAANDDAVLVIDRASAPFDLRWNLPAGTTLAESEATPSDPLGHCWAFGRGWRASFAHSGTLAMAEPSDRDPTSGWHAPRYGERRPLEAVRLTDTFVVASVIAPLDGAIRTHPTAVGAAELDPRAMGATEVIEALNRTIDR